MLGWNDTPLLRWSAVINVFDGFAIAGSMMIRRASLFYDARF
jgi:hypothetical protein